MASNYYDNYTTGTRFHPSDAGDPYRSSDNHQYRNGQETSHLSSNLNSSPRQHINDIAQIQQMEHLSLPDALTVHVVNELKKKIEEKRQKRSSSINDSDIEREVSRIRREINPRDLHPHYWKDRLPVDLQQCSDSVLRHSMAYGDDPNQVLTILKEKMNKEGSIEDPTDALLINITEPLKQISKNLEKKPSYNLFRAVLDVANHEIDRADRMFYSEAHNLIKNLQNYTFDNAHEQVQAIRLMHYQSDSEHELRSFIDNYRTFDDAYRYLQRLAENQIANNSNRSSGHTSTSPGTKSIIRPADDDSAMRYPQSPSANYRPLYNNLNTPSSSGI
ncbi:unnamed protein product [Adineta steineri]|uniref:Uncharacterized protein n=2 Tax=Adineta steineri TaxID=433720 RepID=A0A814YRM0_9BILA|nr:unnamed protein product [Adineta steineri]